MRGRVTHFDSSRVKRSKHQRLKDLGRRDKRKVNAPKKVAKKTTNDSRAKDRVVEKQKEKEQQVLVLNMVPQLDVRSFWKNRKRFTKRYVPKLLMGATSQLKPQLMDFDWVDSVIGMIESRTRPIFIDKTEHQYPPFQGFFTRMLSYNERPVETPTSRLLKLYDSNTHTERLITEMRDVQGGADLAESMIQGMMLLSQPYGERQHQRGVYYCGDWFRLYEPYAELNCGLNGRANWKYWSATMLRAPFFAAEDGVDAVDAMGAFLAGPTIADCGSAVSFAIHYGLLQMMGSEKFNDVFSPKENPLARLIITHTLFDPLTTLQESNLMNEKSLEMIGNPLLPYMDQIYQIYDHDMPKTWVSDFDLELLELGDILHIKGAPLYEEKHLSGAGRGWNVIYAGKREDHQIFAGFWPDRGAVLLTYDELTRMMNAEYNKPQNSVAQKIEEHDIDLPDYSMTGDSMSFLRKAKALMARTMRDDVRDLDDPIVGAVVVYRLNLERIRCLVEQIPTESPDLWHQKSLNFDEIFGVESALLASASSEMTLDLHTVESRGTTFGSYEVMTDTHAQLFDIFSKFAMYMVVNTEGNREFIGLCVTGQAGLGKTHLATATARFCSLAGLKVLVMDSDKVGEDFQERGGVYANYERQIQEADLLVMDDINSKYGCGMDALKKMVKLAKAQKKGLIITSNHANLGYFELTPGLMAFDDRSALNFYSLTDLEGETYRRGWIADSVFTDDRLDEAVFALTQSETRLGCGVIIKCQNPINLVTSAQKQLSLVGHTVYVAHDPMRDHKVFDMYLHSLKKGCKYSAVVMIYLDDYGYPAQFITLAKKTHDLGLRAVVLSAPSVDLASNIRYEFKHSAERCEIRIRDRIRTVFPGVL